MIIGIVGKANVGKSTFFKALTLAEVEIANYPFTTLDKNEGVGYVRVDCLEKEFGVECKPRLGYCLKGNRFVPVKIIDVAGLVPGAHEGKGKGNQFLDDLREADCLIHVLDASGLTDAEGNPTEGYDVVEEVKFLQDEIDLWMLGIVGNNWKRFARKVRGEGIKLSEAFAEQLSGLKICEDDVKEVMNDLNLSENPQEWKEEQLLEFTRNLRKKSKPIVIAANKIDLPQAAGNIEKLKENFPDVEIIPCSAESELALREAAKSGLIDYVPGEKDFSMKGELKKEQKKALDFVSNLLGKFGTTGVQDCLNHAVFSLLGQIVAYPVENESKLADKDGNVLPDAYLLPKGATALDLAEAVHSDVAKGFIAAVDVRSKKRVGKEYELKDGDVIKIMVK